MRKPQIFYGWVIVAAGAMLIAYNSIIAYGFTAFINPIAANFGWSYAQISLAMSLRGLETGALNPLVGFAVDRWPARVLVLVGVLFFAAGLVFLSQISSLPMFYAGFLIVGLGSSLFAYMIPPTMVARWFRKDIGKASGILATGAAIGGLGIPLLVLIMDNYGWQNAFLVLAGGILIMGIPISFLFRNRPEEYGMLPDGKPLGEEDFKGRIAEPEISISVGVALRMRAFWHIALSTCLQSAVWGGVMTYMMPYITSLGITRSTAGFITMLVPLTSLVGRLTFGFLADIYVNKHIWVLSLILITISLVILWQVDGPSYVMLIWFAVFFGLGISGFLPVRTPLFQEYFGIKNFGTILGLSSIFMTVGMVISPPVVGWFYERLGVYDPIWLVLIGVAIAAAIVMGTMPAPKK